MSLAERLVVACQTREVTLGTAESLTAGLVAAQIANIPGCSTVFRGAIIAYHPDIKGTLLGVPSHLLAHVVSAEVAIAMAEGAQRALGVTLAIATTGVAGPDWLDGQPPGRAWIAAVLGDGEPQAARLDLPGSRTEIRVATCEAVLGLAADLVDQD